MTNLQKFLKLHKDKSLETDSCTFCEKVFGPCSYNADEPCPTYEDVFKFLVAEEMPKITDDERAILKCIDTKYKYIARDFDGSLWLGIEEPTLQYGAWVTPGKNMYNFNVFKDEFEAIKSKTSYEINQLLWG